MRPRWLVGLLVAPCLATAAVGARPAGGGESDELMARALLWRGKFRPDRARQMVEKLLAVDPLHADAVVFITELDLKDKQVEAARRRVQRLRERHPDHPALPDLDALLRAYGPEHETLARMRLEARGGRQAEAARLARELFPTGAPQRGELAEELRRLLGGGAARAAASGAPRGPRVANADATRRGPPSATRLASRLRAAAAGGEQAIDPPGAGALARTDTLDRTSDAAEADIDRRQLEQAERRRAELRDAVAASEQALAGGQLERAAELGQRAYALDPDDAEALGALAAVRQRQGRSAEARDLYARAVQVDPRDPWSRFRLARLLRQEGQPQAALAVMDEGVEQAGELPEMRYARALLRNSLDDPRGALADLAQVAAADRSEGMLDLESRARIDLALESGNAFARQGRTAEALEQARWLDEAMPRSDPDQRLALVRLWQRAGDLDTAHREIVALRAAWPQDAEVMRHGARLALARRQPAEALSLYREALQVERTARPGGEPDPAIEALERNIASIEARGESWVEAGLRRLEKSSTPGWAQLHAWERPVVLWLAKGYEGHHFVHLDTVSLDAGPLPALRDDALPFGQVAAWPPGDYAPAPGSQQARGLNIGVGYEDDRERWDVGMIGAGFNVRNWVGGLRRQGDLGAVGYQWDLSRRPLTGSLLTYAGARDPITGEVWGGVVVNQASGRLSTDWGPWSLSTSAGYALLTGRNVPGNSRLQWRGSVDRDVHRDAIQTVNVGLALSVWHYGRDLSNYTFGQAGYYSPQSYVALSLPVEWSGRAGPLTWLLRGTVSRSQSRSDDGDFYPTRPDLQRRALDQGVLPVHAGGSGGSWGRSLRGAVEYRVTPRWAVGAEFDLDRSPYYAPNTLLMYARYTFQPPRGGTQPERPRPVQSYSSF